AATTRRTNDNRPGRPFTSPVLLRPGEQVQIDTNTIDILCRYADGVTRRAELTIAVDVATRSILTAVIAPSTKAVDAVAVLARLLVPQPLRPGWPETLLMTQSALPFDRLVGIDARFELAQALPVILPDTLVCDRGSVYMAETFRRACRHLGISVQPARPYTATDKAHCRKNVRVDQHPVLPAHPRVRRVRRGHAREGSGGRGGVHRRAAAGSVRRVGGRGLAEPSARIADDGVG
ncbi:MAG TPA: hypothetical protein VIC62_08030, partial [Nakamurella sp.]